MCLHTFRAELNQRSNVASATVSCVQRSYERSELEKAGSFRHLQKMSGKHFVIVESQNSNKKIQKISFKL